MFPRSSKGPIGWILAVTTAGSIGCAPARTPELKAEPPELKLEGVRFRLYRGEGLKADGTAATVSFRRDSTELRGTDLAVRLRDKGEPVTLTAPAGHGIVQQRTFEASGGLRAVRQRDVVTTESARFEPVEGAKGSGLVTGEQPVRIDGPGYQMQGTGFTLDPAVGEVLLRGQTRLVAGLPTAAGKGAR